MINPDANSIHRKELYIGGRPPADKALKGGSQDGARDPLERFSPSNREESVETALLGGLNHTKQLVVDGNKVAGSCSALSPDGLSKSGPEAFGDVPLLPVGDPIPVHTYLINDPKLSEQMTQGWVDMAVSQARDGHDVKFYMSPGGLERGFTLEQRLALSDAGVHIQVESSDLNKASSTANIEALIAAGVDVKISDVPSGPLLHQKIALIDNDFLPREYDHRKGSLNFDPRPLQNNDEIAAIIGKPNIGTEYWGSYTGKWEHAWRDVDVNVSGEAAKQVDRDFLMQWSKVSPVVFHTGGQTEGPSST